MKKILLIGVVIVIVAASFFSGCMEETEETAVLGTLQLKITDKPADYEIIHAFVTISTVQVHKSGAGEEEEDEEDTNGYVNVDEDDDGFIADADGPYEADVDEDIQFLDNTSGGETPYNWSWDFGDGNISYLQNPEHNYSSEGVYEVNLTVTDNQSRVDWYRTSATIGDVDDDVSTAGWYTIVNESQEFDLIELRNATAVLGENNLSAGKYTQIRLTVEKANITVNDSEGEKTFDLKIPSKTVKLIKPFWVYEGETTVLTLDFDVNESVHKTGKDKYIMKPTIKVIQE
jgi:hypothetical protein